MYLHKTKNGHYTPPCCYFSGELEVVEGIRNNGGSYDWIEINSVNYCGFTPEIDEIDFERIIESIDPDCIHIWGSEYNHSYYVTKAARNLSKIECTVLSIQGLASIKKRKANNVRNIRKRNY